VETLLRGALSRRWSDSLVELYGRVTAKDCARQLSSAENWLQEQPSNPVLLLTLGRLCLKNKLWGKARSYLEASIGAAPSAPDESSGDRLERITREHFAEVLNTSDPSQSVFETVVGSVEKTLIQEALNRTDDNQVQAAQLLGMHRSTLRTAPSGADLAVSRRPASRPDGRDTQPGGR